jgi:hypothetical protein
MSCAPETFTFALKMTKCDAVVLFIIFWSCMALLHFCAMSTNALCAHVLTVSWIELMSLTPITTPNLLKEKSCWHAEEELQMPWYNQKIYIYTDIMPYIIPDYRYTDIIPDSAIS